MQIVLYHSVLFAVGSTLPRAVALSKKGNTGHTGKAHFRRIRSSYDMKTWSLGNTDHPWMFAYHDYSYSPSLYPDPEEAPQPLRLKEKIAELEDAIRKNPRDSKALSKLGSLFYWECYWIRSGIMLVEEDTDNIPYHWLAIEMRNRYPLWDGIPGHYEAILKIDPDNPKALRGHERFCRYVLKDIEKADALKTRLSQETP